MTFPQKNPCHFRHLVALRNSRRHTSHCPSAEKTSWTSAFLPLPGIQDSFLMDRQKFSAVLQKFDRMLGIHTHILALHFLQNIFTLRKTSIQQHMMRMDLKRFLKQGGTLYLFCKSFNCKTSTKIMPRYISVNIGTIIGSFRFYVAISNSKHLFTEVYPLKFSQR